MFEGVGQPACRIKSIDLAGHTAPVDPAGGTRNSALFRRTACDAVADVYHDLLTTLEVPIINPKFVYRVRDKVESIRSILPANKYLPSEVNTNEFRSGLDTLWVGALKIRNL